MMYIYFLVRWFIGSLVCRYSGRFGRSFWTADSLAVLAGRFSGRFASRFSWPVWFCLEGFSELMLRIPQIVT
jgi:hypothetical protein